MDVCLKLNINFFVLLIAAVIFLGCSYEKTELTLGSAFEITWQFNSSNSYNFNDDLVEFSNGKVQLKPLDFVDSNDDFAEGSLLNVGSNSDLLTINVDKDSDSKNVLNILPDRESNLVGYWRFDNNWLDSSQSQNHGTPDGDAIFNESLNVVGSAAGSFDGSAGRINLAKVSPDLSNNEFSYSFWTQTTSNVATWQSIIGVPTIEVRIPSVFIRTGSEFQIAFGNGLGSGTQCAITIAHSQVSLNAWYHIGVTYKKGTGIRFFIDGVLAATPTSCNNQDLLSGQEFFIQSDNTLSGYIDELAFFNIQITDEEMHKIYSAQKQKLNELSPDWTPKWDQLIGYWKMDGNWQDYSGNGNHPDTFAGGVTYTDGKIGSHAGLFDGVDDGVTITNTSQFDAISTKLSFMGWVYLEKDVDEGIGDDYRFIFTKGTWSNNSFFLLKSENSNGYNFSIWSAGTRYSCNVPGASDSFVGEWVFLTYVFDTVSNTCKSYLNGKVIQSKSIATSGTIDVSTSNVTFSGIANGGVFRRFPGMMDEFALWSETLTDAEVLQIYNRQKQKFSAQYDSRVIDLGSNSAAWPDLSWQSNLPFGKELAGDSDSNSTPDVESNLAYPELVGTLNQNLELYYNFNGNLSDSYSTDTLTVTGSAAIQNNGFLKTQSMYFDNTDTYIDGPVQPYITINGTYSISFWIKPDIDILQAATIFSGGNGSSDRVTIGTAFTSSSQIAFGVFDGTWSGVSGDYKKGEWNHILAVSDNGSRSLYINGELATGNDRPYSTFNFRIGGNNNANNDYLGHFDEFAIWSRALNSTERAHLFRRGGNRVSFQVKSCVDESCNCESYNSSPVGNENDCDGDGTANSSDFDDSYKSKFIGPGGDGTTFYSEVFNRNSSDVTFNCSLNLTDSDAGVCVQDEITVAGDVGLQAPEYLTANFSQFVTPPANRYIQYRSFLEADDNSLCSGEPCVPNLTMVSFNPSNAVKYSSEYVEVAPKNSISFTKIIDVKIDADACATFRLSRLATDYYHDGSSWVVATTDSHRNIASEVTSHIKQFVDQFGVGELHVKSYLKSDVTQAQQCSIDAIDINYQ